MTSLLNEFKSVPPVPTLQRGTVGQSAPGTIKSLAIKALSVSEVSQASGADSGTPGHILNRSKSVPLSHFTRAGTVGQSPLATDADERAAITEEGASVPREWAEGFARMQCQAPPTGCRQSEWIAVVDAAGRFLDRWATQAGRLGWTTADLFGVGPTWARTDARGLLTFIPSGGAVVAITGDTARIRLASGAEQTYRRRAMLGARILWEAK